MMLALLFACVFLSIAALAWGLLPDMSNRLMRRRIYEEVAESKRPSPLMQIMQALGPLNRFLPTTAYAARTTKMIESAGLHLPPLHFLVIQELGAVGGTILYFAAMAGDGVNIVWLGVSAAAGFLVPSFWLNNRIKERRMTVGRDLPEVVDLLTLCVGAGSDFMTAMNRIVREFRPCPVREELGILLQEVRVGKRRRDALRAFSMRLQTPETSTFSRTLIQVDRMGTGLAEALTILSEDMRLQRYHWAERFAQKSPVKMLVPLILSLGSAMIVVSGPILIRFFRGDLMSAPQVSATTADTQ